MSNQDVGKKKRVIPESRKMVMRQTEEVYKRAQEVKAAGGKIAWSTAIYVQEICETLDIPVLYPENHAAVMAAKHFSEDLIGHAEGKLGYPSGICSYARINFAFVDKMKDPGYERPDPYMPLPDLLLLTNNSCVQLMKWYQNLADTLHIPYFFLDLLYNFEDKPIPQHKIDYIQKQIEEAIEQISAFVGKKFDWDRFREIQEISNRNNELFKQIITLNKRKPAPLSGFDFFNYMSAMVICRGKKSTTDILLQLKKEIEEHIANGTSTFPVEEKHRVFWEGIACWPVLGHNFKTMRDQGINAVTNGYITGWDIGYTPGDLTSMARNYGYASTNSKSTPHVARLRSDLIEDYGCEGMVCHMNKSCKYNSFHVFGARDTIIDRTGATCINFDGDQGDIRAYSHAQFETRVQGLAETLEMKKGAV